MEASVDQAIRLVTDPAFRGMGPTQGGLAPVAPRVVGELQQQLGATEEEARALVAEAVARVGGENRSRMRRSRGLGAGLFGRHQWIDDFWVPEASVRSD